jgi:3'-phosphoadenosine 5'-phosphosulfate sulfotransferase (PAPS reductase)/FAD synthetase
MRNLISYSGGKNSTAMLLRMLELKIDIDEIYFADTGLEYPDHYKYLSKIEKVIGREITILKPKHDFDYYFYKKRESGRLDGEIRGFPFVITPCWAQRDLKVRPIEQKQKKGDNVHIGYNMFEKHRMITENPKKVNFIYPLIEWNWGDVMCSQYLKKRGLMNPIYKKVKRSGCWMCPKQPIQELWFLFRDHPALWKRLRQYEKDCPHGFKPDVKLEDLERNWSGQRLLI